jgi:hypothetical protein
MKQSFLDSLNEKSESQESTDVIEAAVETTQEENVPLEVDDSPEEEYEESAISEDTRKQLFEKGSFIEKIKEAGKLQAQEEEEQQEDEEYEDSEEQEEEQEEEPEKPVTFEVEGQTFNSIEEVNTHIQAIHEEKAELQKEVDEIRAFVEKVSDPELVEVLRYVAEGYSYRAAMVKAGMDESIFEADAEDLDAEQLWEAKQERKRQAKEYAKQQEQLQKNMEASNNVLSDFQTEQGFDDRVKDDLVKVMSEFHSNTLNGIVTKESLELFLKAVTFEKALKKAQETGEIQGRNAKITIERKKKDGDGIPRLGRGISAETTIREDRLKQIVNIPSGSFMDKIKMNKN